MRRTAISGIWSDGGENWSPRCVLSGSASLSEQVATVEQGATACDRNLQARASKARVGGQHTRYYGRHARAQSGSRHSPECPFCEPVVGKNGPGLPPPGQGSLADGRDPRRGWGQGGRSHVKIGGCIRTSAGPTGDMRQRIGHRISCWKAMFSIVSPIVGKRAVNSQPVDDWVARRPSRDGGD